jgi:hypothetical protein
LPNTTVLALSSEDEAAYQASASANKPKAPGSPQFERSSVLHSKSRAGGNAEGGATSSGTPSNAVSPRKLTKEALWAAWDANAMAYLLPSLPIYPFSSFPLQFSPQFLSRVVILSPAGDVVYANKEALTFFNLPRAKLVGVPVTKLLPAESQGGVDGNKVAVSALLAKSSLVLENSEKVAVRGSILPQVDSSNESWFTWVQSEAV